MGKNSVKKIVLFASGSGTNVENIIRFFMSDPLIKVSMVFTNNPNAGVIQRVQSLNVPAIVFDKTELTNGQLLAQLKSSMPDLIVLAGFLLKIPPEFVHTFSGKIINIHPSLLPKHGGKGMYGAHVHQSVKTAGDKETGITIHFVNEHYDEGSIIFQSKVPIDERDSPQEIAKKVHELEYQFYPNIIQNLLNS